MPDDDGMSHTREELIAICEDAIVPEDRWSDRDSHAAQKQLGRCWVLLRAGCEFSSTPDPDGKTISVTTWSKGFNYFENHQQGDPEFHYLDQERYYLPTPERLEATATGDWYC